MTKKRKGTGQVAAPYRFIIYLLVAAAAVAVDQGSKLLIRDLFQPGEMRAVIDGLLSITYVMNRGAAFGMLSGQYHFLVAFPLLVSILILAASLFLRLPEPARISMLFVAAGGISNALDRIFLGYVTDMIAVSFFPPVFNVADICVTVGCVCLALSILFGKSDGNGKEAKR